MSYQIEIHSKPKCIYCYKVKEYCQDNGLTYSETVYDPDSDTDYAVRVAKLIELTGHRTFPQVFCDYQFIGGCTEFIEFHQKMVLPTLLDDF